MNILSIETTPFYTIPALIADPGHPPKHVEVPVLRAKVDALPGRLRALIVTGDLQAYTADSIDLPTSHRTLLGVRVANELSQLGEHTDLMPNPLYTGVCLAGDMFALPGLDQMGGLGDVNGVWEAFLHNYRWVVGVGGNHDLFSGKTHTNHAFSNLGNIHALDGEHVTLDDLHIAGLSGIIGQTKRPWRRQESSHLNTLATQLEHNPDLVILHQGPDAPSHNLVGSHGIRKTLEAHNPTLVVCGHKYWRTPLVSLSQGTQVLNVDFRVVVLEVK